MPTELFVEFKRKHSWPYPLGAEVGEGCVHEERVIEESDTYTRDGVQYYRLAVGHGSALEIKVQVRERSIDPPGTGEQRVPYEVFDGTYRFSMEKCGLKKGDTLVLKIMTDAPDLEISTLTGSDASQAYLKARKQEARA